MTLNTDVEASVNINGCELHTEMIFYPEDAGKPVALSDICERARLSPEIEAQFFDTPKGSRKRRSFAELTSEFFESHSSEIHKAEYVISLVADHPEMCSQFHTVGWIAGRRGLTLADLCKAGWRLCPDSVYRYFSNCD